MICFFISRKIRGDGWYSITTPHCRSLHLSSRLTLASLSLFSLFFLTFIDKSCDGSYSCKNWTMSAGKQMLSQLSLQLKTQQLKPIALLILFSLWDPSVIKDGNVCQSAHQCLVHMKRWRNSFSFAFLCLVVGKVQTDCSTFIVRGCSVVQACLTLVTPWTLARQAPWDVPSKNTGVDRHSLP